MATMQHKDIPDAYLHEPKGAAGATNRSVYHSNGAGTGVWRKNTNLDTDYTDKTKNLFGWADIADNQYTQAATRAVGSGVRTQLTNNAAAAQTDTTRLPSRWNTVTNAFNFTDTNSFYALRINFKATAAAAASTPYVVDLEIETASGPTVIAAQSITLKGGGYVNRVSLSVPIYIGSIVSGQALKVFVRPDTNIEMYDLGFVLSRGYVES